MSAESCLVPLSKNYSINAPFESPLASAICCTGLVLAGVRAVWSLLQLLTLRLFLMLKI